MKNFSRVGNIILCGWFLIFLFGTLVLGIFNRDDPGKNGSMDRISKSKSPFSFKLIERYFKERPVNYSRYFVYRKFLIRINNWLFVNILSVSPVKMVILGKSNWLFQAKENLSPEQPGYFSSIQPFTFDEMEKWRIALEQRQRWLEKRGILYLFIPVPDKSSIYPELLPNRLRSFYSRSRLSQLVEHLRQHSEVNFLDLRNIMRDHKMDYLLYHRTDSHWNDYAIYLSYCEIINFLALNLPLRNRIEALKISDFKIIRSWKGYGNLARMLFFRDECFDERRIKFRRKARRRWKITRIPASIGVSKDLRPLITVNQDDDLPKAVLFHDSSGIGIRSFLSEHFARIFYIRDWDFHFRTGLIEREKPHVVLDQISEHFLYNRQLRNPSRLMDGYSIPESR